MSTRDSSETTHDSDSDSDTDNTRTSQDVEQIIEDAVTHNGR